MINEIAPHVFNNEIKSRRANDNDYVLIFKEGNVLMKHCGDSIIIPVTAEVKHNVTFDTDKMDYLFEIDSIGYYLLRGIEVTEFEHDDDVYNYENVQIYRTLEPQRMAFAMITAHQIYSWMQGHRFCGCCGSQMVKSSKERAMVCSECNTTVYPTISPAVTVAIINDDKILLARNVYGTFRKFALVAGFVEIGESFEETVRREVMEEVGLRVKNIRYYKSQPWASSSSEMIGFFVDLDGDDTITRQESEIAEARWFKRDELDDNLSLISLSYEMIEAFRTDVYPR